MITKFTSGPWEWWTSNSLKRLSSGDKDGSVLYAYRCSDDVPDVAISEADMALIAAAPDLYEAAQMAFDVLEAIHPIDRTSEDIMVMNALESALKKARNES